MKITNRFQIISPERPKWEKTEDGFLRCRARILANRIMPYYQSELSEIPTDCTSDPVMMYVPIEEMCNQDSLRSLEGCPVIAGYEHTWLTPENIKQYQVGQVAGIGEIVGQYLECYILITDLDAIQKLETHEIGEISAAYTAIAVFEPGQHEEFPYDGKQTQLRYNHVLIIPTGYGRAGEDVKILNKKQEGGKQMPEGIVRIKLRNTGAYVNVDEESAKKIEEDQEKGEGKEAETAKNLETSMSELEGKNSDMQALQAEIDELKGELQAYKDKLDELLSDEVVEAKAAEMHQEQGEGEEIIENAMSDDKEEDKEKKEEVKNTLRKLHGTKLHEHILNSIGVKTDGMSPDGLKGAFKAQYQIANMMKGKAKKVVVGAKVTGSGKVQNTSVVPAVRTQREKLGLGKK